MYSVFSYFMAKLTSDLPSFVIVPTIITFGTYFVLGLSLSSWDKLATFWVIAIVLGSDIRKQISGCLSDSNLQCAFHVVCWILCELEQYSFLLEAIPVHLSVQVWEPSILHSKFSSSLTSHRTSSLALN